MMNKMPPRELTEIWENQAAGPGVTTIGDLMGAVKRQLPLVIFLGIVGLIVGTLYAFTATPVYQATSSLLIDSTRLDTGDTSQATLTAVASDVSVSSQIEVMRSLAVAERVVDELNLGEDDRFIGEGGSPLGVLTGVVNGAASLFRTYALGAPPTELEQAATAEERRQRAISILRGDVMINREPLTFVINISFNSYYPELAAKVTNAVADAYLNDQLTASYDASVRAGDWVAQRVEELGRASVEAGLAVEEFRRANNLISASGTLVSEQQLSEINSQLTAARARIAEAQATYSNALTTLRGGQVQAVMSALGGFESVQPLLDRYNQTQDRVTSISARLGPDHEQVVRVQAELAGLRGQIFDEYGRVVESYRNAVEVAQASETSLTDSLTSVIGANAADNTNLVRLQELERTAQTYRDLHQNFLVRQQETLQRGSFPVTQARIINEATVPDAPIAPRKTFALIMALFIGCAAGGALGFVREISDRVFRTGQQFSGETGLGFSGYFPMLREHAPNSPRVRVKDILTYVTVYPHSLAANTLRNVRVSFDFGTRGDTGRILGITSAVEGEGKTTVSSNFGHLLARSKKRVILLDLDVQNPALSRSYGKKATTSLVDVLNGAVPLESAIYVDPRSEVHFLGLAAGTTGREAEDLVTSDRMAAFLEGLRSKYDYVVLDLAPLGAVVDMRVLVHFADAVLFVAEWGSTPRSVITRVVGPARESGVKFVGGVLTKTRLKELRSYESVDWKPSHYTYSHSQGNQG